MKAIQRAESDKRVAESEKEELSKKLKDAKGTDKEPNLASSVAAANKAIKDIDDSISAFKKNIKDLRNELKS